MATVSRIGGRADNLTGNVVQADRPVMAEMNARLAQQTEIMAFRCSGNRVNQQYTNITTSNNWSVPYASLTAVSSYSDFSLKIGAVNQAIVGYPFRLSESFKGIAAYITILSSHRFRYKVRLQTRTLNDTVATSTGEETIIVPTTAAVGLGYIFAGEVENKSYRMAAGVVKIDDPTLPAAATRRILVVPQIQTDETTYPGFGASRQCTVFIKSISLFDYPDDKVGF
jgi:hypothetical protein